MFARSPDYPLPPRRDDDDDEPDPLLPANFGELVMKAAAVAGLAWRDRYLYGHITAETDQLLTKTITPLIHAYENSGLAWREFREEAALCGFMRAWYCFDQAYPREGHRRHCVSDGTEASERAVEITIREGIAVALGLTRFHVERRARGETSDELALRMWLMTVQEKREFVAKSMQIEPVKSVQ
jgi:hypothetical protein